MREDEGENEEVRTGEPAGDEEGEEERFIDAARADAGGSPKEITESIFRKADAFTGSAKQYDDMTLLVMKLAS